MEKPSIEHVKSILKATLEYMKPHSNWRIIKDPINGDRPLDVEYIQSDKKLHKLAEPGNIYCIEVYDQDAIRDTNHFIIPDKDMIEEYGPEAFILHANPYLLRKLEGTETEIKILIESKGLNNGEGN